MKSISQIRTLDTKPTAFIGLVTLLLMVSFSTATEARHCGMMKKPHMLWVHPMYQGTPFTGLQQPPGRMGSSVIDITKGMGQFATLLTAIEAADMTGLLQGKGPYTLFAPTDDAFKRLPDGALQELLSDKQKLIAILKYHVVPGRVAAANILQSSELKTASGQTLSTSDLSVIRADIPASNGTIHVIDKVLLPTT